MAYYPSETDDAMNTAFMILAGTDNARGVFHMLADHHREFKDLKVAKIRVFFDHHANMEPEPSEPQKWLELARDSDEVLDIELTNEGETSGIEPAHDDDKA